jgi:hypothetical protein
LMFAFCASVEAKTVTLTAGDHGVLGAMYNAGCINSQWLKRTLLLSGIPESQVNRLPEGTPIVIPDECATGSPNRADIEGTRNFFEKQSVSQDLARLQEMVTSLNGKLQEAMATIGNLNATIANLKKQPAPALLPSQAYVQSGPEDKARMKRLQTALSIVSVIAATAIFSELLILLLLQRQQRKLSALHVDYENLESSHIKLNGESHQLELTHSELEERHNSLQKEHNALEQAYRADKVDLSILYHGRLFTFPDTTNRTVRCPVEGCSEMRLSMDHANMRQHLDTHPQLRIKEISPQAMRIKMGLPVLPLQKLLVETVQ